LLSEFVGVFNGVIVFIGGVVLLPVIKKRVTRAVFFLIIAIVLVFYHADE